MPNFGSISAGFGEAVESFQARFFGAEREGQANEVLHQGRENIFDLPNAVERFASGAVAFRPRPPGPLDGGSTENEKLGSEVANEGDTMKFIGGLVLTAAIGYGISRVLKW